MLNKGAYGVVCSLGNIRCRMFPCSDWAPILENIPDSLGGIKRVKTQQSVLGMGCCVLQWCREV